MEIIKVHSDNEKQLVSARELHKALNVKTRFSQWVEQNFKHFGKIANFNYLIGDSKPQTSLLKAMKKTIDKLIDLESSDTHADKKI